MRILLIYLNRIFSLVFSFLFLVFFFIKLLCSKKKSILFIDIDNSIANTWPFLNKGSLHISYIPPLNGSISFIKKNFDPNLCEIVFLSHREIKFYKKTLYWLKNHYDNSVKFNMLFLVPFPFWKLNYFKLSLFLKFNVFVFDDLSRNHENGEIFYYVDIIQKINSLGIRYFDYEFILKINNQNE
jgi:hypothetical protein